MTSNFPPLSNKSGVLWGRLLGLIRKELYQIIRDPSSILIAFILPLILIFLFGYAVNLDSNRLKIGLVVESPSPLINSLTSSFVDSSLFDVTYSTSRKDIEPLLDESYLRGFIAIPGEFSENFERQDTLPPILVVADGSEPNTAAFLQNYVRSTVYTWMQQNYYQRFGKDLKLPIQVQARVWYNTASISRFFLLPGSIAIIMTIIGTLLTALVIAREWERGTMEAMFVTPLSIQEILLGKLIPYFLLGIGSLLVCFAFAVLLFKVPFRGSFGLLLLISSVFLFTSLSLGLLISITARNQFVASQAALYSAFLPAFLLSGFIFELKSMPVVLQGVTYLIPARYFVTCLQTLFLTGNVYSLLLFNTLGIALIGSFFFILNMRKIRKRLD